MMGRDEVEFVFKRQFFLVNPANDFAGFTKMLHNYYRQFQSYYAREQRQALVLLETTLLYGLVIDVQRKDAIGEKQQKK